MTDEEIEAAKVKINVDAPCKGSILSVVALRLPPPVRCRRVYILTIRIGLYETKKGSRRC